MKNLKTLVLSFMVLALCSSAAMAADLKMGYVDLSRLFDEYYKTKEYDKVLEEKHGGYESTVKAKIEEIQEKQGKLALMKEDQKAALEEEIKKMTQDLQMFDRQEKTTLTTERNEKIREILLEIEKVVSTYAEKEKYSVILNDRVLIYGAPVLDITESVMQILNENKPE